MIGDRKAVPAYYRGGKISLHCAYPLTFPVSISGVGGNLSQIGTRSFRGKCYDECTRTHRLYPNNCTGSCVFVTRRPNHVIVWSKPELTCISLRILHTICFNQTCLLVKRCQFLTEIMKTTQIKLWITF